VPESCEAEGPHGGVSQKLHICNPAWSTIFTIFFQQSYILLHAVIVANLKVRCPRDSQDHNGSINDQCANSFSASLYCVVQRPSLTNTIRAFPTIVGFFRHPVYGAFVVSKVLTFTQYCAIMAQSNTGGWTAAAEQKCTYAIMPRQRVV
jgi:hypothetical protein